MNVSLSIITAGSDHFWYMTWDFLGTRNRLSD